MFSIFMWHQINPMWSTTPSRFVVFSSILTLKRRFLWLYSQLYSDIASSLWTSQWADAVFRGSNGGLKRAENRFSRASRGLSTEMHVCACPFPLRRALWPSHNAARDVSVSVWLSKAGHNIDLNHDKAVIVFFICETHDRWVMYVDFWWCATFFSLLSWGICFS